MKPRSLNFPGSEVCAMGTNMFTVCRLKRVINLFCNQVKIETKGEMCRVKRCLIIDVQFLPIASGWIGNFPAVGGCFSFFIWDSPLPCANI